MSNLLGLLVFHTFFPERILILNTETSVFSAYWYWYLSSILQIEYWYWYFSIWKSYWILNTSILILYWSGLWLGLSSRPKIKLMKRSAIDIPGRKWPWYLAEGFFWCFSSDFGQIVTNWWNPILRIYAFLSWETS